MALLTKRIIRILLDKKNFSKKQLKKFQTKGDSSKSDKDEKKLICYECNKPGHIRPDCPKLKKKRDKKKATIATWSDNDDSSTDEDENKEIANIAFMAMEGENEVCSSSLSYNDLQNEYNELIEVLDDLNREYQLLKKIVKDRAKENVELKNQILKIKNDECLVEKNSALEKENIELKIEIDALKKTFSKIFYCSNKLDKLLGMQHCVFDKTGFGFDEMNKVQHLNKLRDRKNNVINCNYCGKFGHVSITCWFRRTNTKVKRIWVP
ncbi:zf-CCHC domain-containing protein [Cephalotus follicularis]|uniref:Zf-CCHC domain-containing protein n=1 Tax=Cephalotus follicularis TaxID=3775 RepID=A0A1Q3CJ31_CEPFO|nr:zf-CCHC domain-containing protein [Cephalotus follicularis]